MNAVLSVPLSVSFQHSVRCYELFSRSYVMVQLICDLFGYFYLPSGLYGSIKISTILKVTYNPLQCNTFRVDWLYHIRINGSMQWSLTFRFSLAVHLYLSTRVFLGFNVSKDKSLGHVNLLPSTHRGYSPKSEIYLWIDVVPSPVWEASNFAAYLGIERISNKMFVILVLSYLLVSLVPYWHTGP
jgi:hypothetical protein